jgi:hypothetical protein
VIGGKAVGKSKRSFACQCDQNAGLDMESSARNALREHQVRSSKDVIKRFICRKVEGRISHVQGSISRSKTAMPSQFNPCMTGSGHASEKRPTQYSSCITQKP